jgi:hypothetical protein
MAPPTGGDSFNPDPAIAQSRHRVIPFGEAGEDFFVVVGDPAALPKNSRMTAHWCLRHD